MSRGWFTGFLALGVFGLPALALASSSCGKFASALDAGALAAVPPGCNSPRCLRILTEEVETVPRGSKFIYRVATPDTTNSLIVLQRKYVAQKSLKSTQDVLVRREQVPFACSEADAGPEPAIKAKPKDIPASYYKLNYDAYETTIKNGYSDGSADATFINDRLHVLYRNGPGPNCVSTHDEARRASLLLGRDDRLKTLGAALVQRIVWFLSTPAVAAPDHDYNEMRVNIYPYVADGGPRCLGFSLATGGREADIDVSDVEQLVGAPLFAHTSSSVHVIFGSR